MKKRIDPHEKWQRRRKLVLKEYRRSGSIRATARRLRISINTVRRVLRGKDERKRPPVDQPPRPSKLDPFRPVIQRLVLQDQLTGVLVLEEIRALGYAGGHAILREYIRTIRPEPKVKVTTVVEHPPGAEGQVDWSRYTVTIAGERREVHAFSLILPFSRYMVVRFALDETLETLLPLHDEAFTLLGGIPVLMTYDNMTTVGRHIGPGQIRINPQFEPYREACGFNILLIDPGCPNQHASVERPFHYIENNCLRRRRSRFDSFDDLQQHAIWWCNEVANVRKHGTTRERPVDRLMRERPLLLPLPWQRPEPYRDLGRKVGKDYCVPVDTNRYSVPPKHVGHPATVRAYAERLEIFVGGEVVAVHQRCLERDQRKTLPEHEEAFKRCTPSRRLLEQAFLRLGPAAKEYYDGLCLQRGRGAGYHLQRILKLADRHGAEQVTGAMAHAARYGSYSADAVGRVLAGRELRAHRSSNKGEVATPPERVRRWLEGLHVEGSALGDYDRLIDEAGAADEEDEEGNGGPTGGHDGQGA
jgi:transposase